MKRESSDGNRIALVIGGCRGIGYRLLTAHHFDRLAGKGVAQLGVAVALRNHHTTRFKLKRLLYEQVYIAVGRQKRRIKSVGIFRNHIKRLSADGAGAPQYCYILSIFHEICCYLAEQRSVNLQR